ncbi:MAG: sensor histidine kinase [Lachnospiraceae bacterium]|nr:sensor histidine kinase [Lachnospiraceae bacterium]
MRGLSSDQVFNLVVFLEMNLGALIAAFFFGKLAAGFLKDKTQTDAAVLVTYYLIMTILELIPIELESFWAHLIGALGVFLVLFFFPCERQKGHPGKEDIFIKIFVCITFFSIRFHIMSMINQVHITLFDLETILFHRLTDGRYLQVWQYAMVHIGVYGAINLGIIYLSFSLVIKFMLKNTFLPGRRQTDRETLLLLIPGISGMLCYLMIHWLYRREENLFGWQGVLENGEIWLITLFLNVISLSPILLALKLFRNLEEKREEEKRQEILEQQIGEIQSHIREIEGLYSGIRGMKHDVKNHIAVMTELMAKGEYQEAENFLASMENALEQMEQVCKTGNPVTDVIINEKYNQSAKEKIFFKSEFYFPDTMGINAFDISVILNNALENALEAVKIEQQEELGQKEEKLRKIQIRSFCRKQMFLIEVENTFTGTLQWEEKEDLPLSSKKDAFCHGLGLKNIRQVAEKYHGAIDIELRQDLFCLTVMLKGMESLDVAEDMEG